MLWLNEISEIKDQGQWDIISGFSVEDAAQVSRTQDEQADRGGRGENDSGSYWIMSVPARPGIHNIFFLTRSKMQGPLYSTYRQAGGK